MFPSKLFHLCPIIRSLTTRCQWRILKDMWAHSAPCKIECPDPSTAKMINCIVSTNCCKSQNKTSAAPSISNYHRQISTGSLEKTPWLSLSSIQEVLPFLGFGTQPGFNIWLWTVLHRLFASKPGSTRTSFHQKSSQAQSDTKWVSKANVWSKME